MAEAVETTVTDSLGRVLVLKKLDLLNELDVIEAAGAASSNQRWMFLATLAATVRTIDGVPIPFPSDRKSLRSVMGLVKSEGVAAVVKAFNEDIPDIPAEAGPAEADTAKN